MINQTIQLANRAKDLFNDEDFFADTGKSAYKWISGRDFESDSKNMKSWRDYISKGLDDPSVFASDLGSYLWRKLTGAVKPITDSLLSEYTRKVLSDQVKYEVADQKKLHELSGGKYGSKKVLGLELDGKLFLDKETAADEGLRYRTLLHEALEAAHNRPDNSNDEEDHVVIETETLDGLQSAYQNLTGPLKAKAYKALSAFYKTVDAGAKAGDDLATKVAERIPKMEVALVA